MTQFNIPSAINHSCFFDYKNELIHISEAETNYWYALLYLYRTNLLKENKKQKIFLDNGEKTLNPAFNIFRTKIKLLSFNALGITGNSAYKKLEKLSIENNFKVYVRESGKFFIVVAEPFYDRKIAIKAYKLIKIKYKNLYANLYTPPEEKKI